MTDILFLGVGNVAIAVHRFVDSYENRYGTTRSASKLDVLRSSGIEPILLEAISSGVEEDSPESRLVAFESVSLDSIRKLSSGADVLVTFPPDGFADQCFSNQITNARKVVYVSSTSVYGGTTGVITEDTPVDVSDSLTVKRLESEQIWRSIGAIVLRAPSLYGPDYGMHLSVSSGKYKLPGDGLRYSSRIHLEDLALIVESAFLRAKPGSLYVVGDENPATQIEVAQWLCAQLRIPLPESAPLEEVHYTLRSDRQINSEKLLTELGIRLRYPTYKDGFAQCISASRLLNST